MSLVYFFAPLYVCKGLCSRVLAEFHADHMDFRLPQSQRSTLIATVGFAPTTEKEKAEVRDYIVATERNVLTRTKHYLVKSNGKDLNLVANAVLRLRFIRT